MKKQIFEQYKKQPCKAGEQLTIMNFQATIGSEHYDKIISTLDEMIGEGLLEQKENKPNTMFFLTEKGYHAMMA